MCFLYYPVKSATEMKMMSDYDHNWDELVEEYLEDYSVDDDQYLHFIDALVPIMYFDIMDVANKLNLGHTKISDISCNSDMNIYTFLQGAITEVYHVKFAEAVYRRKKKLVTEEE
tara:strand:+ start:377 stop:721 length:345 start_codon:yes stop_codon:yes gene_type:complete